MRKLIYGTLLMSFISLASEVYAQTYKIKSSIDSNITTVSSGRLIEGADQIAETSATVYPSVTFSATGRSTAINAKLAVRHSTSSSISNGNTTTPEASLDMSINLNGEAYVINANAGAERRVDRTGSSLESVFEDSNSGEQIYNFKIQQNGFKRLGSNALFRARHAYTNSKSSFVSDVGSQTNILETEIATLLSRTHGIGARIFGDYQSTIFENDVGTENGRIGGSLQAEITAAFTGQAAVGYEKYRVAQGALDLEGSSWFLGMLWAPTRRLSTSIGYAQRLFGSSPSASLAYTARRSGVTLSWSRGFRASRAIGFDDFGTSSEIVNDLATTESSLDTDVLGSSSAFFDEQDDVLEIIALDMFFKVSRTVISSTIAYTENEEINDSSARVSSSLIVIGAGRHFGRSFKAGAEGKLLYETDESNIDSYKRRFTITTTWSF